jgi:hypothetical protein
MREDDQNKVMRNRCSRCEGVTCTWDELTDEQREVVKRLPSSAHYEEAERQLLHRWCTRCWNESVEREGHQG